MRPSSWTLPGQGHVRCLEANDKLTTGLRRRQVDEERRRPRYKIIQLYRTQCGPQTKVELKIVPKDGKAMCAAAARSPSRP